MQISAVSMGPNKMLFLHYKLVDGRWLMSRGKAWPPSACTWLQRLESSLLIPGLLRFSVIHLSILCSLENYSNFLPLIFKNPIYS